MNVPPIPRDIPVNQIIVTTLETIRNTAIMQLLIQHQKAMMFIGPTGTGKSVYVIVSIVFFIRLCMCQYNKILVYKWKNVRDASRVPNTSLIHR